LQCEANTQWCPEQEACIENCEETCNGGAASTTSGTSEASSTQSVGTSENPTMETTASQVPSTTAPGPSTASQGPSTTSQGPSTTSKDPSTTSVEPSTSEPTLDCDVLCAGMGEIKISDGCCTSTFCQCTNGQENYLYSCYFGRVFCNAWQQCMKIDVCTDNELHCCDGGLGLETTTTTEETIKTCDELCEGLDNVEVGNSCQPNYCLCLNSDGFDLQCEANTQWCPEQEACIENCEETCNGGAASTTSGTSEASSTQSVGTSENPTMETTASQVPSTTAPGPSTASQGPSTTSQGPSTTSKDPSTTSVEPSTSEPTLDCDVLCAGMGEIKISDGCCTSTFCQCTNGQENYLYSCYFGRVFCNAWQQCMKIDVCTDNELHCCDGGLGLETTTTTEETIKTCDELCEGLDNVEVGNSCQPNYCLCLNSDGFDMQCDEENTQWCPEQEKCIENCEETCYGGAASTTSGTSEASSTSMASSETSTASESTEPTTKTTTNIETTTRIASTTVMADSTTVGETTTESGIKSCEDLCEGLNDGYVGNYCQPKYCLCLTAGGYELDCEEENTQWCPDQGTCIDNCEQNC